MNLTYLTFPFTLFTFVELTLVQIWVLGFRGNIHDMTRFFQCQADAMLDLGIYAGRRCVYIEGGEFSLAQVLRVQTSEQGMQAILEPLPECPLVCHYRENPCRFAEEPELLGHHWEIRKSWQCFYAEPDFWDGSLYGGFRALFAPDVVERFMARDLSWVEEYF